MPKAEKLLAKIRNNPKTVSFDDLDKVLRDCGFSRRQSNKGTSHYYYTYGTFMLSVPYKRPHVKEIYVKQALAYIDQIVEDDM
ncbi:MAG: hypothetical protein R6W76_11160 [Caldilinea sp.]